MADVPFALPSAYLAGVTLLSSALSLALSRHWLLGVVVSAYYCYMCPHTAAMYVSTYYCYICARILPLHMLCVCARCSLAGVVVAALGLWRHMVSAYCCYICVRILLLYICVRILLLYICVRILLLCVCRATLRLPCSTSGILVYTTHTTKSARILLLCVCRATLILL